MTDNALTVAFTYPDDRNPAATYLASLKSENSRRVMLQTLRRTLTMFFNCELEVVPPIAVYHFAWHNIRYQHVDAKLTEAQVIEIQRRWSEEQPRPTMRQLAEEHGVTDGNINAIVMRRSWKHIA
jgi:hypothetical protein